MGQPQALLRSPQPLPGMRPEAEGGKRPADPCRLPREEVWRPLSFCLWRNKVGDGDSRAGRTMALPARVLWHQRAYRKLSPQFAGAQVTARA